MNTTTYTYLKFIRIMINKKTIRLKKIIHKTVHTVAGGDTRGLCSKLRVTRLLMSLNSNGSEDIQLQLISKISS